MEFIAADNRSRILSSPFIENVPAAFARKNGDGKVFLYGPYAQFMLNFAAYNRFGLQLYKHTNFNVSRTHQLIRSGHYNLSLHPSLYTREVSGVEFSYPLEFVQYCVLVPLEDELPKYLYIVWPFGRYIWALIGISIVYIAWLLRYVRFNRSGKAHPFASNMLQSMAIVLYCSNMNVPLRNAKLRTQLFYTLLFVLGFILSAYHAPYLTAYNMKPVFFKPINTADDLRKSQLNILVQQDYLDDLRKRLDIDISDLEPYMIGVEETQLFLKYLENLNRSFAYVVSMEQWHYINRQQRQLKQPFFHLSKVCFGEFMTGYPLQANASFKRTLHTFMLAVQQSGLWKQWEEEAFYVSIATGYTTILLDTYPVESLNVAYFRIAWIILFIGLAFSCIAFLAETYFFRVQQARQRLEAN